MGRNNRNKKIRKGEKEPVNSITKDAPPTFLSQAEKRQNHDVL